MTAEMSFSRWWEQRRATALVHADAEGLDVVIDDPDLLVMCRPVGADRAGFATSHGADATRRMVSLIEQGRSPMSVSCIDGPDAIVEELAALGYEEESPGELVAMGHADLAAIVTPPPPAGLHPHPASGTHDVPYDVVLELGRRHDPSYPPDDTAFRAAFPTMVDATVLLVDDGGAAVATASFRTSGDAAGIMAVCVAGDWRGRGVGTVVTALALEQPRARGAGEAVLVATAAGLPIYRRLGFTGVGAVRAFG